MKKPIYSAQEEQALMAFLWSPEIANDPYKFVMAAFPWGQPNTPLAKFSGPRKWQRRVLKTIAKHIAESKAICLPRLLRLARSSGRGIGKSALVSWLVLWFVTTRIGSTAIISANTETQLRQITFAELGKWAAMAINAHWWEVVGIKMDPAKWLRELVERDLQKGTQYWGADGKLWSEDNPDAYAGVHNHDGVMLIFDEASGIPDAIWAVGNGFFTEETYNRFWIAFSQGRRNSGYFFDIFNKKRDIWDGDQIDARTVEGTDPTVYQEIIEEYGADSDEAMVEVYGRFPSNDDISFISHGTVDKAVKRALKSDNTAPIVIGVDPAAVGDKFVIVVRQGLVLLAVRRYKLEDTDVGTMAGVGHVIDAIEEFNPTVTAIDETGMGIVIKHRLTEQKYKVKGVNFASRSKDPARYANKRAEIWDAMKKWLESGTIPNDKYLMADLTGVRKKPSSTRNVLQLESKQEMKKRKLPSPDSADALAVTFAFPVATRKGTMSQTVTKRAVGDVYERPQAAVVGWMG